MASGTKKGGKKKMKKVNSIGFSMLNEHREATLEKNKCCAAVQHLNYIDVADC